MVRDENNGPFQMLIGFHPRERGGWKDGCDEATAVFEDKILLIFQNGSCGTRIGQNCFAKFETALSFLEQ
jgi:hypothetical protein